MNGQLKTILVHVDLSRHAPSRIRMAASVAQAHGATLLGAAMTGISRAVFPHGYDTAPASLTGSHFDPLVDNARRALSWFEAITAETGVPSESRLVCDQADDGLARMARFADLVVTSQDDPDESMTDMAIRVPEYVILNSARPVLVVPRAGPPSAPDYKALVAWDGSKEAACALNASIPFLRQAASVTVATLTGPALAVEDCRAEQDELSGYLKRHEVEAAFRTQEARDTPGRDLLELAGKLGCDLLVMGCYGHGKWRELCLGGASRTVLADAGIPVLLAH
jgi:nucleotide-binding universal stress UspA family protein